MPARNKVLLVLSFILLGLALSSFLSPILIPRGLALWLSYEARRSGLTITTAEIRAPFLHPVEIRGLRVVRAGFGGDHLQIEAPRLEASFHLAALFNHSRHTRPLRSLHIEHARVTLQGRALASDANFDWETLGRLLPERFECSADLIRFEQPLGRLEMHDTHLSGDSAHSGILAIASVEIRGPYLQKNFSDVRGVTRWQGSRLTIGSLHLLDGLDIDSFALDLTRLRAARIAADGALTIYNGNLRANFATERSEKTRLWEVAGSASGISLSQVARALGLTEALTGSLRASKFSFRGDPRDLLHATASLWTELTGFSWRARNADVIMVGANFYERTVQLQELYIKQQANELTLSGETALTSDWLNPDFRGDVSGAINDLGQFAELFGASPNSFAGKVAVRGRVHAHERKVDGELALTGDGLGIFQNPVDTLTARLTLDSPRVRLDQFEVRRGEDFLRGSGQVDFARAKAFEFSADSWCHDLSEYRVRLPLLGSLTGTLFAQIDGSGNENAHAFTVAGQSDAAKFSAKGASRGQSSLAIESLQITMDNAAAAFAGMIEFADPRSISITLWPVSDLRVVQDFQDGVCVRGIEMHPGNTGTPFSQMVITPRQLALTVAGSTTQASARCPEEQSARPLQINVATPQPAPSAVATPLPSPAPSAPATSPP